MPQSGVCTRTERLARMALVALAAVTVSGSVALADPPKKPQSSYAPPWSEHEEKRVSPPPAAALSPDRLRAAWVSDDRKSILSSTRAGASAEWTEPVRLLSTRGVVRRIVFSPDGHSIAYENERSWKGDGTPGDAWEFIAVYDIASRQISYVDPSFDFDTAPSWSRDGASISFTRKVPGLPDAHLTTPVVRLKRAAWTAPPKRSFERFTMADVLAAPFIYPPAPSGDGTAIAYVTREARERNIYVLKVGQPARRIVNYAGDDGADIADSPALSKTGAAIAYVRGGNVNHLGDAPNPNGLADLPTEQVWIVGTQGDTPRLLGPGGGPEFTPDDRFVLWHAHGGILAAALTWKNGRLAGVGAPQEFLSGPHIGMRFSPDGSKIAYHYGEAIEIYDFASKTAVEIPHGKDFDRSPVWSPDGKSIAFIRGPKLAVEGIDRSCGEWRYCGTPVSKQPWSIWVADVATLHTHRIWQARAGVGSIYYPLDQSYSAGQHGDQMLWSADNRIGFVWEGDGWRHLYAVPASGGQATLLTPGNGEVETAALTADGRHIVYSTNIGDLGRRHLAEVGFDGGSPRSLTRGDRDQWAPIPLAEGKLAYVEAGWADPAKVAIRSASGSTSLARYPQKPASYPSAWMVKPELVDFPAADGHKAFGQLFVPAHPSGCAIIFSHGGIRRQMLPGFHYMDAYSYLYEMNQYLASRGCVVLSVEYRSSIMRGEAFRDAPGWGFAGNSELLDFVGAAKYLLARKDVDAARGVGVYGLSWGGYMTSELLARHSDLFKVGFDMAGVHVTPDAEGSKYAAVTHIGTWTSPVFLAQGDDDMNVDFDDGMALARALQARRPNVELKQRVLPGQTHDLTLTFEQLVGIYGEGSDWLIDHLQGGHAPGNSKAAK